MRRSYIIAVLVAVAAVIWVGSGQLHNGLVIATDMPASVKSKPKEVAPPPMVRVRTSVAVARVRSLVFLGRTEASRKVSLKAETAGRIIAVPAAKGSRVKSGGVIVRLSPDDRNARLAEAEAILRQRQIEYQAARELSARKFRSKVKLAEAEANLETARAGRERARLEIARTSITAPFAGALDERLVEVGDFVKIGNPVATFIDLNPICISGYVSELNIGVVRPGMKAAVKLVNGETAEGLIRFVALEAHETTRTYKIEVEVPNENRAMVAGMTAEISIPLAPVSAHKVSPAVLGLSDNGSVGVKSVDGEGRVFMHAVDVIDEDTNGVWITGREAGLGERVTLITVGHEFVKNGEIVQPLPDRDPTIIRLDGAGK